MRINKKEMTLSDLKITIKAIETDFRWAESFYYILFDVRAPLDRIKEVHDTYSEILLYSGWALDIAYVAILGKIFGNRGIGLETMLLQIRDLPWPELHILGVEKEKYENFAKKVDTYLKKINSIKRKISPLRNSFRLHNFPKYKAKGTTLWKDSLDWLRWAEKVFNEACSSIGSPPWGTFLTQKIRDEKKLFFNKIKQKNN